MAKKVRKAKVKKRVRKEWTKEGVEELRGHSKAMTPMSKLETIFKRSAAALRQKSMALGISLGHRKRRKKRR